MASLIMSNMLSFILGAAFCAVVSQQLLFRAGRKNRAELESSRGKLEAEKDALQGRPLILPVRQESPYTTAYNNVAIPEAIRMLQQEHQIIVQRLDQLERNRKSRTA